VEQAAYLSFQTAIDMSVADESRTGVVGWIPTDATWIGSKPGESDQAHTQLHLHLEKSHLLVPELP